MINAYADATAVPAGGRIRFRLRETEGGPVPAGRVEVADAVSGGVLLESAVAGSEWTLEVAPSWRSSLYRARFSPGEGEDSEAWFVVRAAAPGRNSILLSVPFTTWQAYNRFGVAGEGLYPTESPHRAVRVGFDRPGGGPPPERWEEGLQKWLRRNDYGVDYCSCLDLHDGSAALERYRLLIVNGHDEYWTAEQRAAVEDFTRRGGNVAFFAANTSWWQIRLEDGMRTMVCHRDPVGDPLAATDPARTTVEWSSAPANRPENSMTGVSFRNGAGCWGPAMPRMYEESYTARFAGHWVFAGTGLADGDKFGLGALGYETDAAEFTEQHGVPRVTGHDGTPAGFVILATADLSHWSAYGQGGGATMGVFDAGAGTVFNAATVNWGAALDDPVIDRITRNVVERLREPRDRRAWTVIGPAAELRALTVCAGRLYAVTADGALVGRELCGQNLGWREIGRADGVAALAAPREADTDGPRGLYAATEDGRLLFRDARTGAAPWIETGTLPEAAGSPVGLAVPGAGIVLAGQSGALWTTALGLAPGAAREWREADSTPLPSRPVSFTAMTGRYFALSGDDRILTHSAAPGAASPADQEPWRDHGPAGGHTVLAAGAGLLLGASLGGTIEWREA